MRILSLNWEIDHPSFTSASFGSPLSCLDFDAVVWDPRESVDPFWYSGDRYRGEPSLSDSQSATAKRAVARRRSEFKDLLRLGRQLVVVTAPGQSCFIDTGERQYSGTGRNRATTRIVQPFDFLSALPVPVKTREAHGENLAFTGSDPKLLDFWKANADLFYYSAYFQEPPGKPWATIDKADRAVGTTIDVDDGTVLFIPAVWFGDPDEEKIDKKAVRAFGKSLVELLTAFQESGGDFTLPAWTENYRTADEQKARTNLEAALEQVARAERRQLKAQRGVADAEQIKILFAGSGKALESAVAGVFRELGCDVEQPDRDRDDLIVRSGDRVAVVEVKGVTGSAAERYAAQLEKWVSEYFDQHDQRPKGILVVNGFRDTPLADRDKPVFPNQMLKYAANREHALVTGVQLLGVRLEARNDKERAGPLLDSLFNTVGRLQGSDQWSGFLEQYEDAEEPEVADSQDDASAR